MIRDDLAQQLHDRATRGDTLSAEEEKQLEDWYASRDAVERVALGPVAGEKTLVSLQTQVDAALARLTSATKRIQETAFENETLRHEIATLRRRVVYVLEAQPA